MSVVVAVVLVGCAQSAGESGKSATSDEAAGSGDGVAYASVTQECTPLETRDPNASGQEPAFARQTRTCGISSGAAFEVTVVATGLVHPWAVEPLPGGDFLVTERPGSMRVVAADGTLGEPITGLPQVDARRQGGLLDVALSPGFATDRTIYWSYAEPRAGGNATSVARGKLSEDRRSLSDVQVIVRSMPTYDGALHFGSRLAFGADGKLFVTLGERSDRETRPQAQDLGSHLGKILRVEPDGSIPADNPFVGQDGARPEIWTLGHRNVQAAVVDPQGRLWAVEHGPRGGDELNLIERGVNYGWPRQSYGEEYSGFGIRGAETRREGMRQPVYYWDPVIAPSGAEWYDGEAFPAWRGSLFVGSLKEARLVRLELEDTSEGWRVVGEEHLLIDRGRRIRDVRQGPDGALYVVTDHDNGELWRLRPAE